MLERMPILNKLLYWLARRLYPLATVVILICAVTHRYEDILVLSTGAMLLIWVLMVLQAARGLVLTARLYGVKAFPAIRTSFGIDRVRLLGGSLKNGPPSLIASFSVNLLVSGFFFGMFAWWHFAPFMLVGLARLMSLTLYWLCRVTPPSVVFLSTSTANSLQLWEALVRAFHPLSVVSLLNPSVLGRKGMYSELDSDFRLVRNVYRTNDLREWSELVDVLTDMAPTVLIDVRKSSAAVEREAEALIARSMVAKTVVLIQSEGPITGLQSAFIEQLPENERWRCLNEESLMAVLNVEHTSLRRRRLADILRTYAPRKPRSVLKSRAVMAWRVVMVLLLVTALLAPFVFPGDKNVFEWSFLIVGAFLLGYIFKAGLGS